MTKITYKRNDQGKIVREVVPEIPEANEMPFGKITIKGGKSGESGTGGNITYDVELKNIYVVPPPEEWYKPYKETPIKPSLITRIVNRLKRLFDR